MPGFDHKEKRLMPQRQATQPPAWRSSDGRLKERTPDSRELSGYVSGSAERKSGRAPRPVSELKNSYGSIATGIGKRRELTIVVARSRAKAGPQPTEEGKRLHSERAVRVRPARGKYLTGSHNPRESAFGYREEAGKAPFFLHGRLRQMVSRHRYRALEEMMPFLDTADEKESLGAIRRTEREAVEKTGAPPVGLAGRKETVRADITRKEQVERQFYSHLRRTTEKARKMAGPSAFIVPLAVAAKPGETPPGDADDTRNDEDENREDV